ncbi:hypothetical protein C3K47_16420 [Solitalea longa]|uniref:DUF2249 domain-containing protein n=1 Tax=Solitalea longa TaxID=2079460 RepID=A0A2S4ZXX3_9SPHI|nr:DUF2249 domain-containing protein [Solitalea longa]POY35165.1 hypothetical protein C3K47_16420 [Solitalea longa]
MIPEAKNRIVLDVRPTLAQKLDPFKEIMETVGKLGPEESLQLITPFEPVPLYSVMQSKGYICRTERISSNEVHSYFEPAQDIKLPNQLETATEEKLYDDETFTAVLKEFKGQLQEIDVRDLEMPQPMLTILAALEQLPEDHALLVHHKKVPLFLLPELNARDFEYLIYNKEKIDLLIFKK